MPIITILEVFSETKIIGSQCKEKCEHNITADNRTGTVSTPAQGLKSDT